MLWGSLAVVYMTVLLNQTSAGRLHWTLRLIFGLQVPNFDPSDYPCHPLLPVTQTQAP